MTDTKIVNFEQSLLFDANWISMVESIWMSCVQDQLATTFIAHFVNVNTEHHSKPYDPFPPMWMGISSRRLHNINFNGIKMVTLNRITFWVDLHNKLKPNFDSNQKVTTTSTSSLESCFFFLSLPLSAIYAQRQRQMMFWWIFACYCTTMYLV